MGDFSTFCESFPNPSFLNSPDMINLLYKIYKTEPCHFVTHYKGREVGVPAYYIDSFLAKRRITNGPLNFFATTEGNCPDKIPISSLINLAKTRGENISVEYKTRNKLCENECKKFNLIEGINSLESVIPLFDNIEDQRKLYRPRHRTKVNHAIAKLSHVKITEGRNIADLEHWYALLLRLYRDKHQMICQPFSLFAGLLSLHKNTKLLIASVNGEVVGGIFLLLDRENWTYGWGANDPNYNTSNLMSLILDRAIDMAISSKAKFFNFGASPPNDPNLLFFKKQWGSAENPVYSYFWNCKPNIIDLNTSFSLARPAIKHCPLAVLKKAPPFLLPLLVK